MKSLIIQMSFCCGLDEICIRQDDVAYKTKRQVDWLHWKLA